MKKIRKNILLSLALFAGLTAFGQQDTASMITDFNKVMAFSVQPYLHYKAAMKMSSTPIIQAEDTLSTESEFYKNLNNICFRNSLGEMFIADSLFIEIDKRHKKITLSRIDENTLKKMNVLPLNSKEMRELFKQRYTISRNGSPGSMNKLNFSSKQSQDSTMSVVLNIGLQYSVKDYLPEVIEMSIDMKQQLSGDDIQQMIAEDPASKQMVHTENGTDYLKRTQKVTITFGDIDNTEFSVAKMPNWKENINYNLSTGELTPTGIYSDYEIIKNF